MGFADAYLHKAGLRDALIESEPHPGLDIIVIIPIHNESRPERCLESLYACNTSGNGPGGERGNGPGEIPYEINAEVIMLVNAAENAPAKILEANYRAHAAIRSWIDSHPHPAITFHLLLDHSFTRKESGVGTARKILMDEAVLRFSHIGNPGGVIASMDADAVVQPNYLEELVKLFQAKKPDGCSVYFEHPLDGGEYDRVVYDAAVQYELHLRYYLHAVRSTGYPYAFHTVGSCFAVRADIYCSEGGMSRRQGGEDFYFIQKVAQRGNFTECNTTCVEPSPRPSDRVPFGTGPAVRRLMDDPDSRLLTCDPRPFCMLRKLFSGLQVIYSEACMDHFMKSQSKLLLDFLEKHHFGEAVVEIRRNSASSEAFEKRFCRWFNMFRILKFLHFARDNGFPDIPVEEAAAAFLEKRRSGVSNGYAGFRSPESTDQLAEVRSRQSPDLRTLLKIYRQMDRTATLSPPLSPGILPRSPSS